VQLRYLLLLVTTELKVLAALDGELHLVLALVALKTENDLLGGLGLGEQEKEQPKRVNKCRRAFRKKKKVTFLRKTGLD